MADANIQSQIESLAESLIFAELSDPQSLAHMHEQFEQVARWAEQAAEPKVEQACEAAANLLEKLILDEIDDAAAMLGVIAQTVTGIQAIITAGQTGDQVGFPAELGLGDTPAPTPTEDQPGFVLPAHIDETIFSEFLARQPGVLEEFEEYALALEGTDGEKNIPALKRLIHTVKGEAGLLGLEPVAALCHAIEDAMTATAPGDFTDTLLRAKDWLSNAYQAYAQGAAPQAEVQDIIAALRDAASAKTPSAAATEPDQVNETTPAPAPELQTQVAANDDATQFAHIGAEPVAFTGDPDLTQDFIGESREHLENADVLLLSVETNPSDDETLNGIFRAFHTIKGVSGFLALTHIQTLAHEAETLLDKARKGTLVLEGPTLDVIFDAVDKMKRLVDHVEHALTTGELLPAEPDLPQLLGSLRAAGEGRLTASQPISPATGKMLGKILVDQGKVSEEQIQDALETQRDESAIVPKLGELLVKQKAVNPKDVAQAIRSQKIAGSAPADPNDTHPNSKQVQVKETVKVDAGRLDKLVDTIGELVIAEAMVNQASHGTERPDPAEFARMTTQLTKITRDLQEMAMSLRLVPVRSTFQKMARLARDTAKKVNKKINFVMVGEDTELDKTVVDRIGDPLVHMVRNAVDHGIEGDEQDRLAAGKPAEGVVRLAAYHKGGSIYVEISDDGRGLDREAVLKKAIEKGLAKEGDTLTDSDIYSLVLEPGFSTAKQVTDVSGRGVGMDVVKRNIEALRGKIEIESKPGQGSTFRIRLPLTLAIIEGMVVSVGSQRYIIPTQSIVRMLRPERENISMVFDRGETLRLDDELIPLFHVRKLFNVKDAQTDTTQAMVLIVEDGDRRVGLVTDALLGQQQTVIKNLGEALKGITGLAGGAIMPDGRVGLILDISGLVKLATTDNNTQDTAPQAA